MSFHILQPPERQRLFKDGTALEGDRTLADQGIESGDVLALVYQSEGAPCLL